MTAFLLCRLQASLLATLLPVAGQVSCGFPSPAADYELPELSLDALVGIRPTSSIFLMRAWGHSMRDAGIHDGDILIIDKAGKAQPGDVVVAVIGAEFVVKTLEEDEEGRMQLVAANPDYKPIRLGDDEVLEVWGVCLWVLHSLAGRSPA
ncbi:LexA family transcriptional regulator [Pseudomonas sp. 2FE]|uniref:LexA family protein n=1 Tax=Pseudomonas sp. 2FE TaxID=2502190 RepID=UPI0010F57A62|nr:translesion error-prone DNA polymerase V autoproteolytic subunit [Pseudomonas sp. 2FE]